MVSNPNSLYIGDVYSPVKGTQDQPLIETQPQAEAIGKPCLRNQGQSLLSYHMSSFDHIDFEYGSRYGTSFLLVGGKQILFIMEVILVYPVGMEMIHWEYRWVLLKPYSS